MRIGARGTLEAAVMGGFWADCGEGSINEELGDGGGFCGWSRGRNISEALVRLRGSVFIRVGRRIDFFRFLHFACV